MPKTFNPMTTKAEEPFDSTVPWLETQAEVTACHYEFASMNTLTLGIALDSNRFLISFTYYAHAKTFSGEFTSPVAMEQGKTFPIFYNPLNPQENRQSESGATGSGLTGRNPLFAIGIAGSIVISFLYLAMMHGCN
ncbi:MAG TPA: hypothetical protein VMU92_12720 [Acidobacteriaceae bacterium]|nr:hypothetical protein [Acidobacteriaceae bacterium]